MGRQRHSRRACGRLLVLAGGLLLLVLAFCPAAGARSRLTARAERLVSAKVATGPGDRVRVTCHRRRVARRRGARWSCSWSREQAGGRSCRGSNRVSLRRRLWRLRRRRLRCRAAAPRPAPATTPSHKAVPPSAPRRQPLLFGFNDYSVRAGWVTAQKDAVLDARAGANTSRVGVDWRWGEPWKGHYDLGGFDDIYRQLLARGIRPIWMPTFTPNWATGRAPCDPSRNPCHYPPDWAHIADYATFVAELARRYPQSAGIEVWNEPNQNTFWQPAPNPQLYVDMLKATYRAVKAVNPSMRVISGGLADNLNPAAGTPPKQYAQAMYAFGAGPFMDGFGIHPYGHAPGLWERTFADMREVRHAAGADATPFWVTETGATTTGLRSGWPTSWILTEQQQAARLIELYRAAKAMPDVQAFIVHTIIEPPGDRLTNPGVGYGVLHHDLSPKPAYCALAVERGMPSPCP